MTNNNITDPDGTRREMRLQEMGYSTREVFEQREFEASQPTGSYFANALAFIVESLTENDIEWDMIENLDHESMMEFAEMYNFTPDALEKAIEAFRVAANAYNETMI